MKNHTALRTILAAALAVPVAGFAQTPCDLLPPTVTQSLCQVCGGPPAVGGRIAGVGVDYVDQWHAQCEAYAVNKQGQSVGTGKCKGDTTCLPGWEKFQDGGVWKCRQPATDQMKDNCYRGLPLSISDVKTDQDLPLNTLYPGLTHLFVHGHGAANGTSGEMTGGIHVEVGEAVRRAGSNAYCLPPDCQVVELNVPSGAAGSQPTLTLYTPHRYRSASRALTVSFRPTPTPAMSVAGLGLGRPNIGAPGTGPTATPTRTPTAQPARDQSYSASLGCPGGQTSWTNVSQTAVASPVFAIRSALVQATASALWANTQSGGVSACSWTDAYQFTIKALDGQGDVTVSWSAQHVNNYSNPLSLSTSQPVRLTTGRWQIVPDATFPPDFTYTVSFRD